MNSVSDAESSRDFPIKIQDQGLSPPAADDLLELYADFLTTHEEFNNISENLLLRLYRDHDSYSAGVSSVTTSFRG